jgi:hypothetical protein
MENAEDEISREAKGAIAAIVRSLSLVTMQRRRAFCRTWL